MGNGFDAIVIGSGFGGAVMACRLAEKGLGVLVLERGRRWRVEDYPRRPGDAWTYDPDQPEKHNGWIDFRFFPNMGVVQGAAVGGGSLIYANVSVIAPRQIFEQGWPREITYDELQPYYRRAGQMLDVQEIPDGQLTTRLKLMREAAEKVGHGDRFSKVTLAVSFDPDYRPDELEDPFDFSHSKQFTNAQGQQQGTCIHLANCDIGCDVKAKNTLDLNYIPRAEKHGAEVRPLHLVRYIEPVDGGYRVHFDRIEDGRRIPDSETATRVIVAAGSLGSTELMLRCRDQYKTLPGLSRRLGMAWSSNGDFLTPAFYRRKIDPSKGPTITSVIDYLDGTETGGQRFWIQDGGFPPLLLDYVKDKLRDGVDDAKWSLVLERLGRELSEGQPFDNVMPWFAQGIDAADGRFYLGRKWYAPWQRVLKLKWDIEKSKVAIDAIAAKHVELSKATGGKPWLFPTWTVFKDLVTPHPLGGCNMGSSAAGGVVDHACRVFGYPGLWVADGSVVPEAIGRNPSRTIAALAERAAALVEA